MISFEAFIEYLIIQCFIFFADNLYNQLSVIVRPKAKMESQKRIQKYQFNMKRLLGQGSYASVYKGKVIETGEPVAVKVIDKRIFTSNFNLKNLHSQIEIMKKVSHQNIVHLYDVFQTNNNMYIITEICDYDLYHYLKEKRKLNEEEAVDFLKQIMRGIKYLNNNNIIHRDLKPANILLKGSQCKISDFGFAKSMESENTFLKSIVGTPLYMSPQLLQKQKYTNKSDLWSVGLIFYEMLHGKTPWMATNELQLINAIYSQKIGFSKTISELSIDFISKCLAINEDDRISWEEAFEHPLLQEKFTHKTSISIDKIKSKSTLENKSALLNKDFMHKNGNDLQNNSFIMNQNEAQTKKAEKRKEGLCLTPKLHKNISEIRLKKVQALTPKSSFANINNKLKQVWALNNYNHIKKDLTNHKDEKQAENQDNINRRKRHLTTQFQVKDFAK